MSSRRKYEDEANQERSKAADDDRVAPRQNYSKIDNERQSPIRTGSKRNRNDFEWGKQIVAEEVPLEEKVMYKPDFGLSGALAKDERTGNTVNGVTLKWTEPSDAAKPELQWRLYVFKGSDLIETLHLHRQNCYLFGRDERICDVLLAHPSCSKQHAVIQHRAVQRRIQKDDGDFDDVKVSLPYILDLNSTHKTFLNNEAIEDSRYYELRTKDVIRFGGSTREYVVMEGGGEGGVDK